VRGPVPVPVPPHPPAVQSGVPKFVELSVQKPFGEPSSKLGSAIKLPPPLAALAVLFAKAGSPSVASIVAVALTATHTELFSETVRLQDWLPPLAKVPMLHVTVPPTALAPQVLETKLTSPGKVTVTTVLVAASGPALFAVRSYT